MEKKILTDKTPQSSTKNGTAVGDKEFIDSATQQYFVETSIVQETLQSVRKPAPKRINRQKMALYIDAMRKESEMTLVFHTIFSLLRKIRTKKETALRFMETLYECEAFMEGEVKNDEELEKLHCEITGIAFFIAINAPEGYEPLRQTITFAQMVEESFKVIFNEPTYLIRID